LEVPVSSPLQDLLGQLGGDQVARLSATLGSDPAVTGRAVSAAIPMLFGALAANARRPEGAQALAGALDRDHDGSVLDDIAGFFGGGGTGPGEAILGHVLGGRQDAAQAEISRASGLDLRSTGRLLALLAPLVLGALGRHQRSQGLDPGSLTDLLGAERRRADAALPDGLGSLASMFDANHDGSVLDDAARIGAGLLGGLFKSR
jgi:hypothetical protein